RSPCHDGVGGRAARHCHCTLFVRPTWQPGWSVTLRAGGICVVGVAPGGAGTRCRSRATDSDDGGAATAAYGPERPAPRHDDSAGRRVAGVCASPRRRGTTPDIRPAQRIGGGDGARYRAADATRSGVGGGGDRDVSSKERRAFGGVVLCAK